MANTAEIIPITTLRFGLAEHSYQRFSAMVAPGTTKAMLEDPSFWSNVKNRLRTFDEVRVMAEDGSFMARVLVVYADALAAHARVLEMHDLGDVDIEALQGGQTRYQCQQKGVLKWCIVDTETGNFIRQGIGTRSVAERELEEYLRAQAR